MTTDRLKKIIDLGANRANQLQEYNKIIELQNKLDSLENDVYMAISGYTILTRDIDYIHHRFSKLREEIENICKKG